VDLTACFITVFGVENGRKKCHECHKKKHRSQQSLDNTSKQPTVVEAADMVHSAAAAVDSNSTFVDCNVDASELAGQHHEPVIGLSVATLSVLSHFQQSYPDVVLH